MVVTKASHEICKFSLFHGGFDTTGKFEHSFVIFFSASLHDPLGEVSVCSHTVCRVPIERLTVLDG